MSTTHPADYIQRLTAELKDALRSDLYHNEHEQNREWAMKDLADAYPNYTSSPYWPYTELGEDYDNNVMIESEAIQAIEQVTEELLPELLNLPTISTEDMPSATSDAVSDHFCDAVWGDYGVGAYYTDAQGGVYTLDEFVAYLKTGQKPTPERLNRALFTG